MGTKKSSGLKFWRLNTPSGGDFQDPVADEFEWQTVNAVIVGADGKEVFRQDGVEFPVGWSQQAINIVAEKYFRTVKGIKETSVKQMARRVVQTITAAGIKQKLFATKHDAAVFSDELEWLIYNQSFAFNSPVWFNVGVVDNPQASACFIQEVADTMESITSLISKEMLLFKQGSGTGSNLSPLRSSYEKLSGGGVASGPVSFMNVLDAGAATTKSGGTTRRAAKMVVLNIDHPDILAQANGQPGFIRCKANAEKVAHDLFDTGKYHAEFNKPGGVYDYVPYQNANNSVRVTDAFMHAVEQGGDTNTYTVKEQVVVHTYKAKQLWDELIDAAYFCGDPGLHFADTMNRWNPVPNTGPINATNPCSEFVFLDDTACNLASLNLLKFRMASGNFNAPGFEHAVRLGITAMEILVAMAGYPSETIAQNSHDLRPLGIGYANLGALLMAMGLPYASGEGQDVAAGITAIMTGTAYHQSALMAHAVGPFTHYSANEVPFLNVIREHQRYAESSTGSGDLHDHAVMVWRDALSAGESHGYRNAQVSVLAPTGTIAFMMDCDTTGIEPAIALLSYKNLVGGGQLKMVLPSMEAALENLGYEDTYKDRLLLLVSQGQSLKGTLKPGHEPIFQTALGEDPVSVDGHIDMMGAVQPFLSGAISKTINLSKNATREDVSRAYMTAWKLGLKSIAIYRDGCKLSQPVSTKKKAANELRLLQKESNVVQAENTAVMGARRKLPDERDSKTHKFTVGGQDAYFTVGLYEDGTPGETFLELAKSGSTLDGLANLSMTFASIALQYGAPLSTIIEKMKHTKFDPSGFTSNKKIPMASSIADYLARWLELKFGEKEMAADTEVQEHAAAVEARDKPAASFDGPPCGVCHNITQRAGSCWVCRACGTTTGCG